MAAVQYKFNIRNLVTGISTTGLGFGTDEEFARKDALSRYVDMEFGSVTEDQVIVGVLVGRGTSNAYFECEGCGA